MNSGNSSPTIAPRTIRNSLLCLALVSSTISAHEDDHAPRAVDPARIYNPTAMPDRIVLTWTSDPARSQAVSWRTDGSVQQAYAEIALAEAGPNFVAKAERISGETQALETNLSLAHYHTAVFTDLAPSQKYVYRVGDGVNWSEWSHFTTGSADAEPFSFVYFGDAQNDVKSHWSRVVREAFREAPRASFMLHAGDLINRAHNDAEWGEWFYSSGWIHRTIPAIATPGNHEYDPLDNNSDESESLSIQWRPMFAFPENGPEGLEETCYFLDYQGARIVSLNSNLRHEEQAHWLDGTLAESTQKWNIVTMHHPVYSSARGRDNPHIREAWQPIFDKYHVDIVLQGHDHTYARSQLMAAADNVPTGTTVQSEAGTLYVVSVSGPKMYNLDRQPFMRRAAEDTQLYQVITIDGDELRYRAYTAHGELYDGFTLKKRSGQVNELIEEVPDRPENARN